MALTLADVWQLATAGRANAPIQSSTPPHHRAAPVLTLVLLLVAIARLTNVDPWQRVQLGTANHGRRHYDWCPVQRRPAHSVKQEATKMLMSRRTVIAGAVVLGWFTATAAAQFQLYPGAKSDDWTAKALVEAKTALPPGTDTELYVTTDAYDKVHTFYKGNAREIVVGGAGLTLPDGTAIRWSFFILDNGKTLADSKLWLKVQRPSVLDNAMKNVRDVTSIQLVRKK
jgi:hypothetical protein